MPKKDINAFLNALKGTAEVLTCSVCSQLCKDPITLSVCFHSICAEHYDLSLKSCPKCNKELNDCPTFTNEHYASAIEDIKQLQGIFKDYAAENAKGEKSKRKGENSNESTSKALPSLSKNINKDVTSENKLKRTRADAQRSIENSRLLSVSSTNVSIKSLKTLEKKNAKGETALHTACRQGKYHTVSALLQRGANANTKDYARWTPLHECVQNNRLDLVQLLLQYNALINIPGAGNETPLHEAVRYGYANIVEELVKNGADVYVWNCKGETPLQLASQEIRKVIEKCLKSTIIPLSMNLSVIEESQTNYDEIYLYCTVDNKIVNAKLKLLLKNFKEMHLEQKITKRLTHLVVETDENGIAHPTMEIYEAIAKHIWILNYNWIIDTNSKLEPFENYEIKGVGQITNNGPKMSRINNYMHLPGIFDGCHFYLHNFRAKYEMTKQVILTHTNLSNLIIESGGVVLKRAPDPEGIPEREQLVPYHARKDGPLSQCSHYIIYKDQFEPNYNMKHIKALPVLWLLECIQKYQLVDP